MLDKLQRIEFWKEFICTKCSFPEPIKLEAQFSDAEFYDFCNCGCNSFRVKLNPISEASPIATTGEDGRLAFEANFYLADDDKTLEVILLVDGNGNLAYVEIDCCANSYPVPERIQVKEPPYHVHISKSLLVN